MVALTPLSAREGGRQRREHLRGDRARLLRAPHSKNPAGLFVVAFVASCCYLKEEWTTFVSGSVRTIPVRAGAGRIVSGRPSSELTSGEERGGEDAGDGVWTEIDTDIAGGGVYAGCC